MKKYLLTGGAILLALIITGAIIGIKMYNKPPRTIENEEALKVSAVNLAGCYENNDSIGIRKYTDNAVEVSGIIADISTNMQNVTVLTLQGTDMSGVQCSLLKADSSTKKGDKISIKGFCTGYLTDVIVDRGVVVK